MGKFFILGRALAGLVGLQLTLGRDILEGPPVDGWRTCRPGPAFLKIQRKA